MWPADGSISTTDESEEEKAAREAAEKESEGLIERIKAVLGEVTSRTSAPPPARRLSGLPGRR
jgi:hypothetical protein